RLRDGGPATASALATAEHVSQQAIAQHVAALVRAGLVQTREDPSDARKRVISVTRAGHRLFASAADSRHAWLTEIIDAELGAAHRPALERAITLLERLAAADDSTIAARGARRDERPDPGSRNADHRWARRRAGPHDLPLAAQSELPP